MSLFSLVADFLTPAPPLEPEVSRALDHIAEVVDPNLKVAAHFARQLADPVRHAIGYCAGLVGSLPGPIDMDHRAFADDPLVHACFATADDITQMLGRSQAIRDFLAQPCSWENDHFYAMFAARRQEKKQLGMRQQGDVIRNDVPQQVIYFSGQTLIEPSCRLDDTLAGLRSKAFDSLLHTFHAHLEVLRHERDGLRADLAIERAHLAVLRGAIGEQEIAVGTRHLAKLDADLHQHAQALMPEQLLDTLAAYLHQPEAALSLTPVSLNVDRLGVIADPADTDINLKKLDFAELTARDRRLHLALLVRIPRDEANEAVERVRDQQRRFMLI